MASIRRMCLGALLAVSACAAETVQESMVDGRPLMGDMAALTGTFEMEQPRKGDGNQLYIELVDSAGEPLTDATVLVSPWMPAHAHGSVDEIAVAAGPGTYQVDMLWFSMAGYWVLRVDVTQQDRVVDHFTVPVVVAETDD